MVMGVFRRTLWMFLLLLCDVSFLGFADQDYGVALEKTLLFFEAQRSGKLPNNQRVKWRGDSGLSDGKLQGVDLVGGYYDAGDHMKFGLPMAFTVTMLSWAAVDFSKDIKDAYQTSNALYSIKWGTDYFLKAHTQPNVLWGQVGEGDSDHYCWLRPEDMTKSRPAFKIDSRNPGSDLAAETAAALAAASLAFKPYNSTYSFKLKRHAEQLFEFADSHRGVYDDSIKDAADFYSSSGYQDELLWSAAWLYRATEKEYYLKYLVDNAESMGGIGWGVKEFSWDNKYAGLQILITKIVSDVVAKHKGGGYISTLNKYKAKADFFACACLQKNNGGANNVKLTPAGLIYVRQWNNLQYVASASFLLAIYSQYLTQTNSNLNCPADSNLTPTHLLKFAKTQTDYILGKNPKSISYLIGYSSKYPTQVHHRGASIPSKSILHSPVGCVQGFDQWYNRRQPNPNVLHGGLVGGPDQNDNFDDDRSEYEQTEPTITGTAPLLGLFAKLRSSYGDSTTTSTYKKSPSSPPTYKPYKYNKPPPPHSYTYHAGAPLKFAHSITAQWMFKGEKYYRHAVVVKNISSKGARIRNVKLKIRNLTGPIYGVVKVNGAVYAVPGYLKPGSEFVFVYIQGGPRAKVSVYSFQK